MNLFIFILLHGAHLNDTFRMTIKRLDYPSEKYTTHVYEVYYKYIYIWMYLI